MTKIFQLKETNEHSTLTKKKELTKILWNPNYQKLEKREKGESVENTFYLTEELAERKKREKRDFFGSGVRPTRERPYRRRSPFFFYSSCFPLLFHRRLSTTALSEIWFRIYQLTVVRRLEWWRDRLEAPGLDGWADMFRCCSGRWRLP